MAETREIRLDVTEDEIGLLGKALDFAAQEHPARNEELYNLRDKIDLAWVEHEETPEPPDTGRPYPTREMVQEWYRD